MFFDFKIECVPPVYISVTAAPFWADTVEDALGKVIEKHGAGQVLLVHNARDRINDTCEQWIKKYVIDHLLVGGRKCAIGYCPHLGWLEIIVTSKRVK